MSFVLKNVFSPSTNLPNVVKIDAELEMLRSNTWRIAEWENKWAIDRKLSQERNQRKDFLQIVNAYNLFYNLFLIRNNFIKFNYLFTTIVW